MKFVFAFVLFALFNSGSASADWSDCQENSLSKSIFTEVCFDRPDQGPSTITLKDRNGRSTVLNEISRNITVNDPQNTYGTRLGMEMTYSVEDTGETVAVVYDYGVVLSDAAVYLEVNGKLADGNAFEYYWVDGFEARDDY